MMRLAARSILLFAILAPLAACHEGKGDTAPVVDAPSTPAAATGNEASRTDPQAGAKDAVLAAGKRMLAAGSYHARVETRGGGRDSTIEADYVAPDRFRILTPAGTQVVIGDTMYMQAGGRSMTVPVPAGALDQWRGMEQIERNIERLQVEALGPDAVDGMAAEKYRTTHAEGATPTTLLWVGEDGYPLRVEATSDVQGNAVTSTVTYSRFNDPSIVIEAPN